MTTMWHNERYKDIFNAHTRTYPKLTMKLIYLLGFHLIAFVSCQDKGASSELQNFKHQELTEQENIQLITRLFNSFNEKDINVFKALTDTNWNYYYPSTNPKPVTRDEMIKQLERAYSSSARRRYDINEIIASENRVVVSYSFNRIHEADSLTSSPEKKEAHASSIILYTIHNGKITEVREEYTIVN